MSEGARNGAGMVDEYRAFVGPWGFTLDQITVPTAVHQGTADTLVPPKWADVLVSGISGATLTTHDGEGHMIGVSRRAEITSARDPAIWDTCRRSFWERVSPDRMERVSDWVFDADMPCGGCSSRSVAPRCGHDPIKYAPDKLGRDP